ncbi:hypothetical protein UZ73_04545 [Alcaligenes faecalis]|nr:hypothetical protein UZ73_04545 [Alcaligenes faecalis]
MGCGLAGMWRVDVWFVTGGGGRWVLSGFLCFRFKIVVGFGFGFGFGFGLRVGRRVGGGME